jgi:uncharacterized protein (DUF1919 family)
MQTQLHHEEYGALQPMHNDSFDWKSFLTLTNDRDAEIPDIVHFIFGLKEQTQSFLFCYYLAVYSAYIINKPEQIYLYHHYPVYGQWWDKLTQDIPVLKIIVVDLPTHIGNKVIKKTAHRADKLRMDILFEQGGVYMDIDTISIRPYKHLLKHDVVLGKQFSLRYRKTIKDNQPSIQAEAYIGGICNAIMFTKPKSDFFKLWLQQYESAFEPDKWEEASIFLPYQLHQTHPELATVLEPDVFFMPTCFEPHKIFKDNCSIPRNLITLHLCETFAMKYIDEVNGWYWSEQNQHTMYAKIMRLIDPSNKKNRLCIVSNNCYGNLYYQKNNYEYNTPFIGLYIHAPCYMKLLEHFQYYMKIKPKPLLKYSKYGPFTYPVATIDDDIEIHFLHEKNIDDAISKWERRKARMLSVDNCLFKLCDRDSFTYDIGERFCKLPFHRKLLFVSNKFTSKFDDVFTSTRIISLSQDDTPDGVQLEHMFAI